MLYSSPGKDFRSRCLQLTPALAAPACVKREEDRLPGLSSVTGAMGCAARLLALILVVVVVGGVASLVTPLSQPPQVILLPSQPHVHSFNQSATNIHCGLIIYKIIISMESLYLALGLPASRVETGT